MPIGNPSPDSTTFNSVGAFNSKEFLHANSSSSKIPKTVELDTRIELASYSFAQKDFDRTSEHAQQVLEEVPGDPRALALVAACEILVGNIDEGITRLNQAIHGTAIDCYGEAAEEAYEYMRFTDDSTVEISWSGFNECIQFLSQPEFICNDDVSAWQLALERARACVALDRNDLQQGIDDLRAHLRRHPADVEARYQLGRAYFHQHNAVVATELFHQVLDVNPDHASANSLLGRISAIEGDFIAAVPYARVAFEQDTQNCRTRLDLVDYLYSSKEYREALNVMDDAPNCSCGWFRILHARMECYRELGDFDAVLSICRELLDLKLDDVGTDIDLALGQRVAMAHKILALAKTEGQEPSLTLLEQEVDSFVVDKRFALDMAGLYRSFEEFELARRLVECLAYELPNDSSVLLALSIAEGEAGHVTEELRLLKELIKGVNSVGAMPQLRLSQAYERQGRLAEALYWANQGLQIDDSNGQLSYQAARINASLGATKPSRDLLGNAISINTSYRGRAHADEVFALLFRVDG